MMQHRVYGWHCSFEPLMCFVTTARKRMYIVHCTCMYIVYSAYYGICKYIDLFAKVNEELWPLHRHNIIKLTQHILVLQLRSHQSNFFVSPLDYLTVHSRFSLIESVKLYRKGKLNGFSLNGTLDVVCRQKFINLKSLVKSTINDQKN